MGGTADGGQTAPQDAPSDLVTVREAAQAVGLMSGAVRSWIARGMLPTQASRQGRRRVSLAAVRALCAAPEPQPPDEARLVSEVAPAVGVLTWRIVAWLRQGRLPSWRGPHGLLVCEGDVRALAQKQGLLPRSDEPGA